MPSLNQFRNLSKLWLQKNRVCQDFSLFFSNLYDVFSTWYTLLKIQKLDFLKTNENLTELYLQNNLIQDVDGSFRNLRYLKILFLHGNQLTNIESVTNELSYLQYLENLSKQIKFLNHTHL
jgi:Leucine-rich repeat (LRR) protein